MPDMYSRSKRSEVMAAIRSTGTKSEEIVFRYLRSSKIYFQKHYKNAPGKPDIALPRKKKAIFIDGDFWHGRNIEKINKLPKNYWQPKIKRNKDRDNEVNEILIAAGWSILRIWESDILRKRTRAQQLLLIKQFLTDK